MQDIQLSDHFTLKRLLRFVLSPIVMMVFTSIYTAVDGVFVNRFAESGAFTALNLIYPFLMCASAIGFMMGAGGNAVVSKTLGEENRPLARRQFTLIVIFTACLGVLASVLGFIFVRPVAVFLSSFGEDVSEKVIDYCVVYGRINFVGMPFFMLQNMFQGFLITAERPRKGFVITVCAGVTNIVLDALFVAVLGWGIVGAAVATILSQAIGGITPLFFFFNQNNNSPLYFTKTQWYGNVVLKSCTNGFSEFLGNISSAVVSMLYNAQLLKYVGEQGVDAYGIVMYIQFAFIAIFIGYSIGVAPIIGFNYGAKNRTELSNVYKKSLQFGLSVGTVMCLLSFVLAMPIAQLFSGGNIAMANLTAQALRLNCLVYLMCGVNIFASSFFTALGNGLISAVISFCRVAIFQATSVMVLPLILTDSTVAIFISGTVADAFAFVLNYVFLVVYSNKYHYKRFLRLKKPIVAEVSD